jgi:hypothetical protein
MENVILQDSPLAEFLEGMAPPVIDYKAWRAHDSARRRQRKLTPGITDHTESSTGHGQFRTARPLDAPDQDPRQAPQAAAHTRAQRVYRPHPHRMFCTVTTPPSQGRPLTCNHRRRSTRASDGRTTSASWSTFAICLSPPSYSGATMACARQPSPVSQPPTVPARKSSRSPPLARPGRL